MTASAPPDLSRLKRLSLLPPAERAALVALYAKQAGLSEEQWILEIKDDWDFIGRPKQLTPTGGWTFWLLNAGRGFGKTISGAQWTKKKSLALPGARGALVAPTLADVRVTMVEGESGLLSILPDHQLRGGSRSTAWNRGTCELYLANETFLKGYSSEVPDRLRGPQHHFAWGEEVSSWEDAKEGDALETTFSNLKLGLRLGENPQAVFTSTPKANKLTKDLLAIDPEILATSRGSSFENRDNLSEVWWRNVVEPYVGTRLGRQEIEAEVLTDVEGALWTIGTIDGLRVAEAPPLYRVVVGVDPNASSDEAANSAGIVVAGRDGKTGLDRHGYVLADRTVVRATPRAWATAAIDAYHEFEADRVIAEKNNGGEMVSEILRTIDPSVPVKLVWASRGKRTRAEPISTIYEGSETMPGRIHHVGPPAQYAELEEEMTTWTPESESPDRMDALVWAMTELMLGPTGTMKASVTKGRIPTATR